ncbi:hypothetical protein SDC9_83656 [bioreactor metagenome]|uniref:Nudix hydrolase domain-containing protein n=1 Tax=bioreactor metagenome TaxID=1076179 RepID=A0A644ZAY6_9ZZZZ
MSLRFTPLTLVIDENKSRSIAEFKETYCDTLLTFLKYRFKYSRKHGKTFTNEKKLCLASDIKPPSSDKIAGVLCHKGTYYDTYLTNHIVGTRLQNMSTNEVIADFTHTFPIIRKRVIHKPEAITNSDTNNTIELKDITNSDMNNEIGISTLGFSQDNFLVIWKQSDKSQSSSGLLVPTGSGSCDWKDICGNDFTKTITQAMERELWEESGRNKLASNHLTVGKTLISGYFRWITRAGKPEFVGITKVNARYTAFTPDPKELNKFKKEYPIDSLEDIPMTIQDILSENNVSIPLYMALLCLEDYYRNHSAELNTFLFE